MSDSPSSDSEAEERMQRAPVRTPRKKVVLEGSEMSKEKDRSKFIANFEEATAPATGASSAARRIKRESPSQPSKRSRKKRKKRVIEEDPEEGESVAEEPQQEEPVAEESQQDELPPPEEDAPDMDELIEMEQSMLDEQQQQQLRQPPPEEEERKSASASLMARNQPYPSKRITTQERKLKAAPDSDTTKAMLKQIRRLRKKNTVWSALFIDPSALRIMAMSLPDTGDSAVGICVYTPMLNGVKGFHDSPMYMVPEPLGAVKGTSMMLFGLVNQADVVAGRCQASFVFVNDEYVHASDTEIFISREHAMRITQSVELDDMLLLYMTTESHRLQFQSYNRLSNESNLCAQSVPTVVPPKWFDNSMFAVDLCDMTEGDHAMVRVDMRRMEQLVLKVRDRNARRSKRKRSNKSKKGEGKQEDGHADDDGATASMNEAFVVIKLFVGTKNREGEFAMSICIGDPNDGGTGAEMSSVFQLTPWHNSSIGSESIGCTSSQEEEVDILSLSMSMDVPDTAAAASATPASAGFNMPSLDSIAALNVEASSASSSSSSSAISDKGTVLDSMVPVAGTILTVSKLRSMLDNTVQSVVMSPPALLIPVSPKGKLKSGYTRSRFAMGVVQNFSTRQQRGPQASVRPEQRFTIFCSAQSAMLQKEDADRLPEPTNAVHMLAFKGRDVWNLDEAKILK